MHAVVRRPGDALRARALSPRADAPTLLASYTEVNFHPHDESGVDLHRRDDVMSGFVDAAVMRLAARSASQEVHA